MAQPMATLSILGAWNWRGVCWQPTVCIQTINQWISIHHNIVVCFLHGLNTNASQHGRTFLKQWWFSETALAAQKLTGAAVSPCLRSSIRCRSCHVCPQCEVEAAMSAKLHVVMSKLPRSLQGRQVQEHWGNPMKQRTVNHWGRNRRGLPKNLKVSHGINEAHQTGSMRL